MSESFNFNLLQDWFGCSVQFSSVKSCPTLCDPMNHSTPGLPVLHQLPEFTQTHVEVGDAIQPSHPLSSPSPPAPFRVTLFSIYILGLVCQLHHRNFTTELRKEWSRAS